MHYGVKGQKWGVRRYQNEDGSLTAEGKARRGATGGESFGKRLKRGIGNAARTAVAKTREHIEEKRKENDPSRMTDQELRDRVNRLNMERQYKQLVKELNQKPEKMHKWREHPVLKGILTSTATAVVSTMLKKEVQTRIDEKMAPKRAARAQRLKAQGNPFYNMDPDAMKAFRYFGDGGKKK